MTDLPRNHRIYLAGPMTGIAELNFPQFHRVTGKLRALGFRVVNPAEINVDPTAGWAQCMRADIPQLLECTAIAMLPGWETSRGAKLEHHIAMALGFAVEYFTHEQVAA